MEEVRLQKYLANCGIASRRKAEELIVNGKISINGKVVTELGTKVNPKVDKVLYKDHNPLLKVPLLFLHGMHLLMP